MRPSRFYSFFYFVFAFHVVPHVTAGTGMFVFMVSSVLHVVLHVVASGGVSTDRGRNLVGQGRNSRLLLHIRTSTRSSNTWNSNSTVFSLDDVEMFALELLYSSTNGKDWSWSDYQIYGVQWNFSRSSSSSSNSSFLFNPCKDKWQV